MILRTCTVVWTFIAASGVVAYVLMLSTDVPAIIRYVCAWYALAVLLLVFAAVGITLSVKFKRLDTTEGLLARLFFFGWW